MREIDLGARLFTDQAVKSENQSGGITAHTINQTINVRPTGLDPEQHEQHQLGKISEAKGCPTIFGTGV